MANIDWKKTEVELPDECRPVLAKVPIDGGICIVVLTLVCGAWVTDASVSEVYGCEPHMEIHADYTPVEWTYFD